MSDAGPLLWGQISDDDRGPANIEIRSFGPSSVEPQGVCVVQFPPDTRWIGLSPAELEGLIGKLQGHLAALRTAAAEKV